MSNTKNFGGSSNMRTQIQNLWQAINAIDSTGAGGNVNFISSSASIGQHYKITSTDGKTCDKSDIIENNTTITFNNKNLGLIRDISSNKFIVNGGSNQQYLMADGSLLQQSAVSGNSNFYLYNNHSGSTIPPPNSGFIGYNNSTQADASIIYINHTTRDSIDIEIFYSQITQLNDVYIQDQNNSNNFIRYNITAIPTIVENLYISILQEELVILLLVMVIIF